MKVNILTPGTTDLLKKLDQLHKPPKRLFSLGAVPTLSPWVAIVGSRKASSYGRTTAYDIAGELARLGVGVVSGLAIGIDAEAHRGALEARGATIAILPSSVQTIYPASNRQLAEKILNNSGALISEYPPSSSVRKHNFIERNRVIAALADALIVVEAAERSGTLSTVGFALELGRPVLAVPGPINSPTSRGTNQLIASGATLFRDVDSVLAELGMARSSRPRTGMAENKEEAMILEQIAVGITSQDALSRETHLPPERISSLLTALELKGAISHSQAAGWLLRSP